MRIYPLTSRSGIIIWKHLIKSSYYRRKINILFLYFYIYCSRPGVSSLIITFAVCLCLHSAQPSSLHLHQERLLAVIITCVSVETPTCSPGDRTQISCTTRCGRGINVTQRLICHCWWFACWSRRSVFYNVIDHLKLLLPWERRKCFFWNHRESDHREHAKRQKNQ